MPALEELERDKKIRISRTEGTGDRDGQLKTVFLDDVGDVPKVDEGQSLRVSARAPVQSLPGSAVAFKKVWHALKTPDASVLPRELEAGSVTFRSTPRQCCDADS